MKWLILIFPLAALAADLPTDSIRNFRVVAPSVFRGGNFMDDHGATNLASLVDRHVAVDIDLQGGDAGTITGLTEPGESAEAIQLERQSVEHVGVRFVNFPLNSNDTIDAAEASRIEEAIHLLASATSEAPAYIHCEHGVDRTGMVIALYRVLVQKWTRADAHSEWVADGHGLLNQILTGRLDAYFNQRTIGLP